MDGTKMQELRELVEFLKANEIAEFDMEQADLKVRIKFAGEPPVAAPSGLDLAQLSRLVASAPAAAAPAPVAPGAATVRDIVVPPTVVPASQFAAPTEATVPTVTSTCSGRRAGT